MKRASIDREKTVSDIEESTDYDSFHSSEMESDVEDELLMSSSTAPSQCSSRNKAKKQKISDEAIHEMEINRDLYQSNLFKEEMDSFLREVTLDYTKNRHIDDTLWTLKDILENDLDEQPGADISALIKHLDSYNIRIPFSGSTKNINYTLSFKKPSRVRVIGSYLSKTILKSRSMNVDLLVEIPKDLFQEKDYLNNRYWNKRAYYLSMIALALKNSKKFSHEIYFGTLCDDPRLSLITVEGVQENFSIRIIPSISSEVFSLSRLSPCRNAIRSDSIAPSEQPATPHYNNALIMNTQHLNHMVYMYSSLKSCPCLVKAILLMKAFVRKRCLCFGGHTYGAISEFAMSMIMACLVRGDFRLSEKPLIDENWNEYQIFRATIDWISRLEGYFFMAENKNEIPGFDENAWKNAYKDEIVFVDPTGLINLTCGVDKNEWDWFKNECRKASIMLSDSLRDHFNMLFLPSKYQMFERFDHIAVQKLSSIENSQPLKNLALDFGSISNAVIAKTRKLFVEALSDRIKFLTVRIMRKHKFALDRKISDKDSKLVLGFSVNPSNYSRVIDLGPPADSQNTRFRQIWGEKVEVRRFKDGSILEAVVWDEQENNIVVNRAKIFRSIIGYLFSRHLSMDKSENLLHLGDQFSSILDLSPKLQSEHRLFRRKHHNFRPITIAFHDFSRKLRDLDNIPLKIVEVKAAHSALRYSSAIIPQPLPLDLYMQHSSSTMPYIEPIDVVLHIEASNRWPSELDALQKMKTSYLLSVAQNLKESEDDMIATVVKGESSLFSDPMGISALASGYLDVTTAEGFTFRCRVHYEHEMVLIERSMSLPNIPEWKRKNYKNAMEVYRNIFIFKPRHTNCIQSLVQRYPVLSQVIRMTKRWLACHWLLSSGKSLNPSKLPVSYPISEEVVEWLCASVILSVDEYESPGSALSGFVRVLSLLASFNFTKKPFIVETTQGILDDSKLNLIHQKFQNLRKQDVHGNRCALFMSVLTDSENEDEFDSSMTQNEQFLEMMRNSHFTLEQPQKVILNRIRALAMSSLKQLDSVWSYICKIDNFDEKSISNRMLEVFRHNDSDYHLVLELDRSLCTSYYQAIDPDLSYFKFDEVFKNLMSRDQKNYLIDFDPTMEYLRDLHAQFGDTCWFFHDKFGGHKIGVVFDPSILNVPRPFKPSIPFPLKFENQIVEKKRFVSLDVSDVTETISILGKGFVLSQDLRYHLIQ